MLWQTNRGIHTKALKECHGAYYMRHTIRNVTDIALSPELFTLVINYSFNAREDFPRAHANTHNVI